METRDLRLDGNAIGGLLHELFGVELTAAPCVCGNCGAREEMARLDVYVHGPSGGFEPRPAEDVDEALWDAALDSTAKGGICIQRSRTRGANARRTTRKRYALPKLA